MAADAGDAKIKSWHDGLFKSWLAVAATTGPIRVFLYSTEKPWATPSLRSPSAPKREERAKSIKRGVTRALEVVSVVDIIYLAGTVVCR
jgi:hypothetical protein